jgi:RHS repeat-associated protein
MKQIHLVLCTASFVTLPSQLCSAALQAPLPEFQSPQQLESRKHAIQEANASMNGSNETFYTGKPFDTQRQGYVFEFRSYSPELSRWTSTDPSGFPDGANNQLYVSTPTEGVDRTGLSDTLLSDYHTPETGATGANFSITTESYSITHSGKISSTFQVQWTAPKNIDGWVVQHVHLDWNITSDTDSSVSLDPDNLSGKATDYWEAWDWQSNRWGSDGNVDSFSTGAPIDSNGNFSVTATVDFYQNGKVTADDPNNWLSGVLIGIPSGTVRATTIEPSWWAGTGFNHNQGFSWE